MTRASSEAGFTLIEALVALVVTSILSASGVFLLVTGIDLSEAASSRDSLAANGTRALEWMARDCRRVRGGTSLDILALGATSLSFVDSAGTTITWRLTGGVLERNDVAVVDGATALRFDYYGVSGAAGAGATGLTRIDVSLALRSGHETISLRTSMAPRNLEMPLVAWGGS